STGLGVLAIAILYAWVPDPTGAANHASAPTQRGSFWLVLRNAELWRMDAGVFVLHALMTSLFIAVPLSLESAGIGSADQWQIYVPAVIGALVVMLPLVFFAERRGQMRTVFLLSIMLLALAPFAFTVSVSAIFLGIALAVFFGAFSALEAMMPSRVSKIVSPQRKGTALGVYASCQFFGAFAGGVLGGLLYGAGGALWLFIGSAILALLWFCIALGMAGSQDRSADLTTAPHNSL
ncbi:MAG: MFS transporter, partial [Pseudomonadota bacterium]